MNQILVSGAREHNLRDVTVAIPRDSLTVITGLSGSGKSSLAFDTIYAEGQRRYVESLSAYARQFLGQMDKPDVDSIEGLSPAISIDQKTTSRNPRSTVGTVTEIYDYLRLLWSRIGQPHCHICGRPITGQSAEQIIDQVMELGEGTRFMVLAPIVRGRKGEYGKQFEELRAEGFGRVKVDGEVRRLDEEIALDKKYKHDIAVIVDRLVMKGELRKRLADSIETAVALADGLVEIELVDEDRSLTFSERFACPVHGPSLVELEPRIFSFNSPHGACQRCTGLGSQMEIDPDLVVPDPSLSIGEGAIAPWAVSASNYYDQLTQALAERYEIDLETAWQDLPEESQDFFLYGTGSDRVQVAYRNRFGRRRSYATRFEGIVPNLERRYRETDSDFSREKIEEYMTLRPCPDCKGARLRPESRAVLVAQDADPRVRGAAGAAGARVGPGARSLRARPADRATRAARDRGAAAVPRQRRRRLPVARTRGRDAVGRRGAADPSGDADRLLACRRPLHPRRAVDRPAPARQREADRDARAAAGSGQHGAGGRARRGHDAGCRPPGRYGARRRRARGVRGCPGHRPRGRGRSRVADRPVPRRHARDRDPPQAAQTGGLRRDRGRVPAQPSGHRRQGAAGCYVLRDRRLGLGQVDAGQRGAAQVGLPITCTARASAPAPTSGSPGLDQLDKIISVDQSPIGRTPRSNPATYIGLFDQIRELFSKTQEARARGYKPGRFSFNVKGGRCEVCRGDGQIKIEMHFLPDVYVPCEQCHGKRYNRETLEVRFKGKTIADVLEMPIEEALEFFEHIPKIRRRVQALNDVGLGYMRLGQPATTLSGGEAQRVKLAAELSKVATGRTMYILDEPTTGLHFADIQRLLEVLQRLVDAGNSVIVIEHNLDVIKVADRLIDLGPEGGDEGGQVIAVGTPEDVATVAGSYTGTFLAPLLPVKAKRTRKAAATNGSSPGGRRAAAGAR